jgi:hypothetical protein
MSLYLVKHEGAVIGTSALEQRDASMGVAWGQFLPTAAFAGVQDVFRQFAAAHDQAGKADPAIVQAYYDARDRLGLTVESESGQVIPTEAIHIADFRAELGQEACELEVHLGEGARLAE